MYRKHKRRKEMHQVQFENNWHTTTQRSTERNFLFELAVIFVLAFRKTKIIKQKYNAIHFTVADIFADNIDSQFNWVISLGQPNTVKNNYEIA